MYNKRFTVNGAISKVSLKGDEIAGLKKHRIILTEERSKGIHYLRSCLPNSFVIHHFTLTQE